MEGQPSGGWGAGPDPPSVLMFLHYEVSNKRKSVVSRSYALTIFLVGSSSVGQVPRSDPTSAILRVRLRCSRLPPSPSLPARHWLGLLFGSNEGGQRARTVP